MNDFWGKVARNLPAYRTRRPGIATCAGLAAVAGLAAAVSYASWWVLRPAAAPAALPGGNFRAPDLQGRDVAVSPGREARCLLLFFCPCQNCRALARGLRLSGALRGRPDIRVVGVLHASPGQARAFNEETGFPGQLLVDEMGSVSEAYGVEQCPDGWLVRRGRAEHLSSGTRLGLGRLREGIRSWSSSR